MMRLVAVASAVECAVAWTAHGGPTRRVAPRAATLEKDVVLQKGANEKLFDWEEQQWYPLAVTEILDEKRPHTLKLMNKDLVAWKSPEGWKVFDDACPHRLAPLSEGRIEADGTLLCAYHAWRFDDSGECVSMPQATGGVDVSAKCSVASYPVKEIDGLLWVFGDSSDDGRLKAALSEPPVWDEIDDPRASRGPWNVRELPYGYDMFMENVMDPAHVPVSHHGLVGSRYDEDMAYDMTMVREPTSEGFAFTVDSETNSTLKTVHEFKAPSLTKISSTFEENKAQMHLYLYAAPSRPGYTKHIGTQVFVKGDDNKLPKGLAFFSLPMPIWLNHVLSSLFLHQDAVFLHHQEKILAARGYEARAGTESESYSRLIFAPNPQDKMVITFRNWLRNKAGGGVPWFGRDNTLPAREHDSRKLFDVWSAHTKDCTYCLAALKNIKRFRFASAILAIVAVAALDTLRGLLAGSFFGALALAAHKFSTLFYVYEFSHADND